jgi:protein-tyrosine phosphatase
MTWTDIHSHILPGFDDGASSDEELLQMARMAAEGGTSLMAATPHCDCETLSFEPSEAAAAVEAYNGLLKANGIPLVLTQGMEVRVNAGLFELAREGDGLEELCLGNSKKYILVDLPLADMPVAAPDILYQVQLRGITPILAHPERNRYLVEHPAALKDLVERGIEVQVNSGSLAGIFGKQARNSARLLLKEGAARLVASDAHGTKGRNPDLSGAAKALTRLLGKEAPRLLLEINPGRALDGENITND